MIDRRLWPSAHGPDVHTPDASGPRCASARVMRFTASSSAGARGSRARNPATPHIERSARSLDELTLARRLSERPARDRRAREDAFVDARRAVDHSAQREAALGMLTPGV